MNYVIMYMRQLKIEHDVMKRDEIAVAGINFF